MTTLPKPLTDRRVAALLAAIAGGLCVVLAGMGRIWWCEVGDLVPWSWDIWTPHNSQHLIDAYSLSHIEHGIGLFLVLTAFGGRRLSVQSRTLMVACVEAAWEVLENTSWMINRYRESTISLDYFGDSILNSVSDYGMCLLGVLLVRKAPWQVGVAAFVVLEIVSVLWIRDSLLLNILMLTVPIEAIKQWQAP